MNGLTDITPKSTSLWAWLVQRVLGRSSTEATRLLFNQEKSRLHFNPWLVVIASWSRLWEKRHYELKVRSLGDFFLDRIAVASLSLQFNHCGTHQ
jgi:hypothetical protein